MMIMMKSTSLFRTRPVYFKSPAIGQHSDRGARCQTHAWGAGIPFGFRPCLSSHFLLQRARVREHPMSPFCLSIIFGGNILIFKIGYTLFSCKLYCKTQTRLDTKKARTIRQQRTIEMNFAKRGYGKKEQRKRIKHHHHQQLYLKKALERGR